MTLSHTVALGACLGVPAFAAGLNVGVEIPRQDVAEAHRPYVAMWIERADATVASTLTVWYDVRMRNNEGTRWLRDMRQWWRRGGQNLSLPIDGVTGATRPVGRHQVAVTEGSAAMPALPAGSYKLVVEAAREKGGRESVAIPFQWPATKAEQLQAKGSSELGEVTLELKP